MNSNEHCCVETPLLCIERGDWRFHAKAKKDISEGTVITRNEPLAKVLHRKFSEDHCAYCFVSRGKLSRCSTCQMPWYCGRDCQRKDFKQHKLECSYVVQTRSAGTAAANEQVCLLLRTNAALKKAASKCVCSSDVDGYGIPTRIVCGTNHWELMAQAPLHLTAPTTTSETEILSKLIDWTPQDIASAVRIYQANNFGILNSLHETIGQGVYPHSAILNHSCDPNCVLRYVGGTKMEIVALRDVAEGEELTHSYVDLVLNTKSRRERLECVHGFRCDCRGCLGQVTVQLPLKSMSNIYDWIIENSFPSSATTRSDDELKTYTVDEVYSAFGCTNSLDNLENLIQQLRTEASLHFHKDDLDSESECLARAVELLETENAPPLSMQLYQARAAFLSTLLLAGNFDEARRQCRAMVAFLVVALPPNHPLLGLQLYTLGDLEEDAISKKRAFKWAKRILQVSHGKQHELVLQLEE